MYERFTKMALRCTAIATGYSRGEGGAVLEARHALYVILRGSVCAGWRLAQRVDVYVPGFWEACLRLGARAPALGEMARIPIADSWRAMILASIEIARRLGHKHLGTAHLLVGAMEARVPEMEQIAGDCSADLPHIAAVACDLLGDSGPDFEEE